MSFFGCSTASSGCGCCAGSNDNVEFKSIEEFTQYSEDKARSEEKLPRDFALDIEAQRLSPPAAVEATTNAVWITPRPPKVDETKMRSSLADDVEAYEALGNAKGSDPGTLSAVEQSDSKLKAKPRPLAEDVEDYGNVGVAAVGNTIMAARKSVENPQEISQATMTVFLPKNIRGETVLLPEGSDAWRLTNSKLRSPAPNGLAFRRSKKLDDKIDRDLAWGQALNGVDEGDWVRFRVAEDASSETVYLPINIKGCTVLVEDKSGMWCLTNSSLNSPAEGVGYRLSKNMSDKIGPDKSQLLAWGAYLEGSDEGDGWIRSRNPNAKDKPGSMTV